MPETSANTNKWHHVIARKEAIARLWDCFPTLPFGNPYGERERLRRTDRFANVLSAAKRLLCRITLSPFHAGYPGMLAQNAVP
jgi:hypothetical protein